METKLDAGAAKIAPVMREGTLSGLAAVLCDGIGCLYILFSIIVCLLLIRLRRLYVSVFWNSIIVCLLLIRLRRPCCKFERCLGPTYQNAFFRVF